MVHPTLISSYLIYSQSSQLISSASQHGLRHLRSESIGFRFWVWSVGRSLSGLSADDLKVKFPVVICPVLTVYFLTNMLLCVPRSVLFQKSCYFVSFRRTCLTGCLRPTYLSPWCTIVFICIFSPLPSISIFPTFPMSPIPPN